MTELNVNLGDKVIFRTQAQLAEGLGGKQEAGACQGLPLSPPQATFPPHLQSLWW